MRPDDTRGTAESQLYGLKLPRYARFYLSGRWLMWLESGEITAVNRDWNYRSTIELIT